MQTAVVFNKTQFPEFIHEIADPGSSCANHLRQGLLRRGGETAAGPADSLADQDEDGNYEERQQGQLPRQVGHRARRDQHEQGIAQDDGNRVGDHEPDAADIVRDPRLDLTRPRGGEESQRHLPEMGIELLPQVVDHPLPDHVGEVRLGDRQNAAKHDRRHHRRDEYR